MLVRSCVLIERREIGGCAAWQDVWIAQTRVRLRWLLADLCLGLIA